MATPKPDYYGIDFREHPEKYRVSVGEMGVLTAMPYKAEILPFWRFKDPDAARESSEKIYQLFLDYKANHDFIGMDMARKFLQMGYTRSRRYANHKGGKKYDGPVPADKKGQSGAHGRAQLPRSEEDPVKAASARIFYAKYLEAREDPEYKRQKKEWQEKYG
ncbi:DUF4385 domain-containing protein [Fibrella arboris]|uniref:DUF4385 domain-containing protein n=1 Tax=Fibrella arboris TaxID=3242486 RepID=UPI003522715B